MKLRIPGSVFLGAVVLGCMARALDECPRGWDAITLHHLLSHTLTSNRRVVEHGGRVPGFGARLRRFVDEDVTVVVLANRLDAEPGRAAAGLSAVAFGEPHE